MNKALLTAMVGGGIAVAALQIGAFAEPSAYAGALCHGRSASDSTGLVNQDQDTHHTALAAGPWAATDATSVTLVCGVSVGDDSLDPWDAQLTNTSPGNVGSLSGLLAYVAPRGEPVYLCSAASWTTATSTRYAPTHCKPLDTIDVDPTESPSPAPSPSATSGSCPPGETGGEISSQNPTVGPIRACVGL